MVGDIITQIGNRPVTNVSELIARLSRRKPGDKVNLTILRDGKKLTMSVTLGKKSADGD